MTSLMLKRDGVIRKNQPNLPQFCPWESSFKAELRNFVLNLGSGNQKMIKTDT